MRPNARPLAAPLEMLADRSVLRQRPQSPHEALVRSDVPGRVAVRPPSAITVTTTPSPVSETVTTSIPGKPPGRLVGPVAPEQSQVGSVRARAAGAGRRDSAGGAGGDPGPGCRRSGATANAGDGPRAGVAPPQPRLSDRHRGPARPGCRVDHLGQLDFGPLDPLNCG